MKYSSLAPGVFAVPALAFTTTALVVKNFSFAPAVYAEPAPAFASPALVVKYISPAPAVICVAPALVVATPALVVECPTLAPVVDFFGALCAGTGLAPAIRAGVRGPAHRYRAGGGGPLY